jgi:hypothetical protein
MEICQNRENKQMNELPEWTDCIFKSSKWDLKTEKEREEFVNALKDVFAKYPEKDNWTHDANTLEDIVASMFNDW